MKAAAKRAARRYSGTGPHCMDALRISPQYTSLDWGKLSLNNPEDWPKAAGIVRDRLHGRFLRFATDCLKDPHSGFVVLAIDCLLAETIQQFVEGVTNGDRRSKMLVTKLLAGPRFQPDFDEKARKDFYTDIRCGLLHQAEAKSMWLIRRKQEKLLQRRGFGTGYIVDVERLHASLQNSLNDYLAQLCEPNNATLRTNLWNKMDHICSVRTARGALYEADCSVD
jgi:hypothetical protein